MSNINVNKKALLDYKEKLLAEIKYHDKSIEDLRANDKNNNFYDYNSSDSEEDWLSSIDVGLKAVELKREQSKLRTYLQATQELTGLTVLQFEVNVLVEEPQIDGEPTVLEAGTWREVTADCRVDLIPFSITFFVHTPDRKFGQVSYRGARAHLVKAMHESELAASVLRSQAAPADVLEVLRSYAASYRSRRTTLARLANSFTSTLLMEPHDEGGFVMKCANLLEVVWRLENKWSPVAPFHHKMKFDLEYMDETYIKIISQCHKQLSDPSLQTDERTLILAKIITTCLEAKGQTEPLEAVGSDLDSKTTDCDLKKDSEVMAPPKSIPQKAKSKIATHVGRAKSNDEGTKRIQANDNDRNDENSKNVANTAQTSGDGSKQTKSTDDAKNKNTKKKSNIAQKTGINDNGSEGSKRMKINDSTKNLENAKNVPNTAHKRSINDKNNEGSKRMKSDDNIKVTGNTEVAKVSQDKNSNTEHINKDGTAKNKAKKSIATAKNSTNTVPKTSEVNENTAGNTKNVNSNRNKAISTKIGTTSKETKNVPDNINTKNKTGKVKNDASTKNSVDSAEAITAAKDGVNAKNKVTKDKNKLKDAAHTNTISNSTDKNKVINKKNDNIDANIKYKGDNNIKSDANTKNKTDSANAKKALNSRENQIANIKKSVASTKNTTDSEKSKRLEQYKNEHLNADAANAIEEKSVAKTKNRAINYELTSAKSNKTVENDPKSDARLKSNSNTKTQENIPINNTTNKVTEKNTAHAKLKDKIADRGTNRISETRVKDIHRNTQAEKVISGNMNSKLSNNILLRAGNIKTSKIFESGNIEKENGRIVSKIPQMKLTPISEKSLKSNPLRISPRTFLSKFKTQLPNKNITKTTNIPRLLKKSAPNT